MKSLKNSGMSFKLKNGQQLIISPEDVEEITRKIVSTAIRKGGFKIIQQFDTNADKARQLYKITRETKDMPRHLKLKYYHSIAKLMCESGDLREDSRNTSSFEDPF